MSKKKQIKPDPSLWKPAPKVFRQRHTTMEVYGLTDTGKTSFAFTAPGPVGIMHFHDKVEMLMEKTACVKNVYQHNYYMHIDGTLPPEVVKAIAQPILMDVKNAWMDAVKWSRTIILDTHTVLWILFQLAHFGTQKPDNKGASFAWNAINADWLSFIKYPKQFDCNVILIGDAGPKYIEGHKPGTGSFKDDIIVRKGQKSVHTCADVSVYLEYDGEDEEYVMTVKKPWNNGAMRGFEWRNDKIENRMKFPELMGLITETDSGEWG